MRIAIAGAAGNLGLFASHFLADLSHELVLLVHKSPLPQELVFRRNAVSQTVDLGNPESLKGSLQHVDCVVSLAGVLFKGGPEKFLPRTNTEYVANLVNEASDAGVNKFILISFPHVEGETFPASPARGILPSSDPEPIHSSTRLEAERRLIAASDRSGMKHLILRAGVVYGKNVKLIEAARRLMRWNCLAVWSKPTWVHLFHIQDFLNVLSLGIDDPQWTGILNVADSEPLLLQEFMDALAQHWGYRKPLRLPDPFFFAAAHCCDLGSRIFGTSVPLNPDILRMGMTSSVADISRLTVELGYKLKYPTLREGLPTL